MVKLKGLINLLSFVFSKCSMTTAAGNEMLELAISADYILWK